MTWCYLLLLWLMANAALIIYYRRDLLLLWREPVLRQTVLIIESDDWGAGPVAAQAAALNHLVNVLTRHQDSTGRHPVMALALVLAVPDGPSIRRDGHYHRITLEDPKFAPVVDAIEQGRAAGVFALQLHGLEHYWSDALMASREPAVRAWLEDESPATTERLPSHLQSRWVDASVLPSRALPADQVTKAVGDEVRLYERIFRERSRVAVPPTFVWDETVEQAWADAGIVCVVTPGLRSACRDSKGLPACDMGPIHNAQKGSGVSYVVRNDYFEPCRGRGAAHALRALARATREGRPCLLENHRDNFIQGEAEARYSLEELDKLYGQSLAAFPQLRFLSTRELGEIFKTRDAGWLDTSVRSRLRAVMERLRKRGRLWKLATLTGLSGMALLVAWLWPRAVDRSASG